MENGQKHDSTALSNRLYEPLVVAGHLNIPHLHRLLLEYWKTLGPEEKQNITNVLIAADNSHNCWFK